MPLTERNERIYGNHLALSRRAAHRVALALQEALQLPSAAVDSDGRGRRMPVATNDTAQGRALNRRIEVEFWHDDPLQELPGRAAVVPGRAGERSRHARLRSAVGPIAPLAARAAAARSIPAGYAAELRRAMTDIAGKTNVRLRFIGYTKNERLDRRTAIVYGDDIGLSTRARAARWRRSRRDG